MDRAFPPRAEEPRPAVLPVPGPQRIAGRYRVVSELGRGGMGAVYRVFDEGAERVVALKLLEQSAGKLVSLFEREYETLAKLAHPRVIEVYDYGFSDHGGRFYTMELLAGADLVASAPLAWVRCCEHLRDVCTSLSLLHAQRLVHRDVNPRNVRLDATGRAKLLDFGALAPFGVSSELVGTPSCMAPEVLRGEALDARTDLFSLGAVAYWSLTGRLPYAIRRVSDAEQGWTQPPLPPSSHVSGIPKALDALILSLLSVDRLGRPASAAEVIDRLSAVALLDDSLLAGIAESHLSSVSLAGREPEQAKAEQLIARTLRGRGGTLVCEGSAGIGRSRMLAELHVDAQLAGLSVVKVSADGCSAEGELLERLLLGLCRVAPQEVRASLPRYQALLRRVREAEAAVPEALDDVSREPHERAIHGASALVGLIREVCVKRPLLIAVDDAHCAAPLDAGVLPLLSYAAQEGRLLLCVTRATEASGPPAVEQLRFLGSVLSLQALDPGAVEQLVHSIFGEVPHRTRLARWLVDAARGNPGQTMLLLRELVARGVIRYAQGAWVLPAEINDALLPDAGPELDDARLSRLDDLARALAELLAVQRGWLSEALCVRLVPEHAPHRVLEALARLRDEKLIGTESRGYRLLRDSLRKRILSGLSGTRQRALHLRLAHALRDGSADRLRAMAASEMQGLTTQELLNGVSAGLHFLCAGQEALGTTLLRAGAVELTIRGDGLTAALPDLELAIETYRKQGVPRRTYMTLMIPLTLAGTYADFRLSYRYGDEVLRFLCEVAGVAFARKLSRFLGGRFALLIGLAFGFTRHALWLRRSVGASFKEILLGLMGIGSAVLGVCTVLQDRERARAVGEQLAPLGFFPARHPVRMVHEFQRALVDHAFGQYEASRRRCQTALAYVQSEAAAATLPEDARLQLEAGIYIVLGQLDALRTDGSGRETLAAIDKLHTSTSRQTQAATRVAFHGHRGERESFLSALDEMDRLAAQAGSIWRNDVQVPRMLWSTYAMCEDVMSLKRAVQQLETLAGEVPSVARLRDVTQASYLSERGMASEALARYEAVFEALRGDPSVRAVQALGGYARILRKAGQPARARELCEEVLARLDPEQLAFTMLTFGLRLEHALSLAQLGETARAHELVCALQHELREHDNPLLHGLLHGALAELALVRQDRAEAQRQLAAMGSCFRRTEHPALFAQFQRLSERARASGSGEIAVALATRGTDGSSASSSIQRAVGELHGLLENVVQEAQAEHGYLFALHQGELRSRAQTASADPPRAGLLELRQRVVHYDGQRFETELAQPASDTGVLALSTVLDEASGVPLFSPWHELPAYCFLLCRVGEEGAPLGALLLVEGERPLRRISALQLARLTRELAAG